MKTLSLLASRFITKVLLVAICLLCTVLILPAKFVQASAAENEPVIQLYHLEGRRSFRVIWTCEELGIECELKFKPGDFKASNAMLRKVNPWVPMWPTAVYNGHIMVESGAIVELLVNKYGNGKLVPDIDSKDYAGYLQWMHFAEGTAQYRMWAVRYASMVSKIPIEKLPTGHTVDAKSQGLVGVQAVADYMEYWLSRHPYFGGEEFSAADIMMQFCVASFKLTAGFDTVNFPHIQAWNAKMKERPAFKRAMARSVPQGANEYGLPSDMELPFPEPTTPPPVPSKFPVE